MKKGDECWIIENGSRVVSVVILSIDYNRVLLKTQDDKILKLPKHRLYDSEESAVEVVQKRKSIHKKKSPYDYMI